MSTVLISFPNSKVAQISFNDPSQLNAMGQKMADDFKSSVSELKSKSNELRAIILTGEGRAFSAGGDLQMLYDKTKLSPEENKKRMLEFYNSFLCILDLNIPVISAINGAAIGASLCVACATDIRISAENSKFGFTFTKLGLHPGMAATYFLSRITSDAVARELLLTGRVFDAKEAQRIGLVSKIVPDDQIIQSALMIAEEIISTGKQCSEQLLAALRNPKNTLLESLEVEATNQSINYASKEFLEGITAAKEKRKANF
jgi:enoyl-CoA hydratase/carnithine racemase